MSRPVFRVLFQAFDLVWVVLLCSPTRVEAQVRPRVYVGLYLRDVTRFDQRNGTLRRRPRGLGEVVW